MFFLADGVAELNIGHNAEVLTLLNDTEKVDELHFWSSLYF